MLRVMLRVICILLALTSSLSRADIAGVVVAVFSGDTIEVMDEQSVRYRIGLVGVAAPARDEPYGQEARAHLVRLFAGSEDKMQQVRVELSGSAIDGRLMAKVWVQPRDCARCGKTLNVNHAQILAGLACWERGHANDQSAEDQGRYASAEEEARLRQWGLWKNTHRASTQTRCP